MRWWTSSRLSSSTIAKILSRLCDYVGLFCNIYFTFYLLSTECFLLHPLAYGTVFHRTSLLPLSLHLLL